MELLFGLAMALCGNVIVESIWVLRNDNKDEVEPHGKDSVVDTADVAG